VASHLTITPTPGVNSRSIGGSGTGGSESSETDVFAALLGTAGKPAEATTTTTSESGIDLSLGNLVNLSFGFGGEGAEEDQDPEAIAAVVDAVVPFQTTTEVLPVLTDVLNGLADLKASLAAGESLDPEALKRLDAALANLAEAMNIDLDALPSLDDLAAIAAGVLPDDTSFEARLTAALAPMAETLLNGNVTAEADAGAELTDLVKSIGDKLAALLASLNSDDASADQLAQLGVQANADLDAALARLATPLVEVDTQPVLAAPELKLPESVLTGKARVDAAPATDAEPGETADAVPQAPAAASDADEPSDRGTDSRPDDRKSADPRPTAVAAPVDKQPDTPSPIQSVQTARADVVAAPRVVQAGYQTSQQQLNLPQLAFELVRQVSDGNTRFQIRLDPAELGKIDVRLDIDASGQINARLTVEKAETLDLMQRDQRGLEKALQQAGLDGAKTNLEFSLKQNPFSGGQQGQNGSGRQSFFGDEGRDTEEAPPPTVNLYRGSLSASGVNLIA